MIEEKLIEKGMSRENLECFARLNDCDRENVFRMIVGATDIEELRNYNWGDLYVPLAEVLKEEGEQKGAYTQVAAQKVALEMLETLHENEYHPYQSLTLDQLYQDTIKRLELTK